MKLYTDKQVDLILQELLYLERYCADPGPRRAVAKIRGFLLQGDTITLAKPLEVH